MNQNPGLIGKKLGSTQLFLGDRMVNCSVIEATPLVVVGHRTKAKDGYTAVILGLGKRKASRTTKPLAGQFKKANVEPPQTVKELRVDESQLGLYPVGGQVDLNAVFQEGQFVDVQGKSRGRGFTGVVRRWSFAGFVQTHGTHEYRRHGGSIGTNMTPGRTLPGKKMPGQHGNTRSTMQNLKVVRVIADQNLVLIEGAVPGAAEGIVTVRGAIKNGRHA